MFEYFNLSVFFSFSSVSRDKYWILSRWRKQSSNSCVSKKRLINLFLSFPHFSFRTYKTRSNNPGKYLQELANKNIIEKMKIKKANKVYFKSINEACGIYDRLFYEVAYQSFLTSTSGLRLGENFVFVIFILFGVFVSYFFTQKWHENIASKNFKWVYSKTPTQAVPDC